MNPVNPVNRVNPHRGDPAARGPGVYHADPGTSAAGAAAEAAERGMATRVVAPVGSTAQLFAAVAQALSFPEWFGANLDALADCLADLSWLPPGPLALVWADPERLRSTDPHGYRQVVEVLRDAAAESATGSHPLTVVLTDS